MRIPKDLTTMQNLLVTIKMRLPSNIAIVLLGNEIALFDFTHNRTLAREPCTNQGYEAFMFTLSRIKRYLYVMWTSQNGHTNYEHLQPALKFFIDKYGFIPKLNY